MSAGFGNGVKICEISACKGHFLFWKYFSGEQHQSLPGSLEPGGVRFPTLWEANSNRRAHGSALDRKLPLKRLGWKSSAFPRLPGACSLCGS